MHDDASHPAAPASGPGPWGDLTDTQRRIVLALLRRGRLSRTDLMDAVGISPGSVTRLTGPLVEQGLLVSTIEQVASTGRPQSPLDIAAEAESVVGVSLSPHSLTAVLTDLRLEAHASAQVPLTGHSPADVVSLLADAVAEVRSGAATLPPPACLGVTLGGASHDGRVVDEASFFGWNGVRLADLVERSLGVTCSVGNDLTGLTLSEAWFGTGRRFRRFDVVTVGSGVGFGLVVDGEVVTDRSAELGLMGAVPVPDGGRPPTASPAMGCLTNAALERAWQVRTGTVLPATQMAARAEAGDPDAVEVASSFARRLGRLVGMAAAFTLPEAVVVLGERADVAALFEDQVKVGVAAVRRPGADSVEIEVREHRRTDWARGAAALALRSRILGSAH